MRLDRSRAKLLDRLWSLSGKRSESAKVTIIIGDLWLCDGVGVTFHPGSLRIANVAYKGMPMSQKRREGHI